MSNAAAMTSNATRRRNRPPRVLSGGQRTIVTGSESIRSVQVGLAAQCFGLSLDPMAHTGTWLSRQASLFNKYKYVRCTVRYSPFVPTSQAGRVIIGWCGDDIQSTSSLVDSQVSQFANAVEFPVWMAGSCNFVNSRTPEYVVSSTDDDNTTSPGKFVVYSDNGPSTPIGAGSLYLDYEIMFMERSTNVGN